MPRLAASRGAKPDVNTKGALMKRKFLILFLIIGMVLSFGVAVAASHDGGGGGGGHHGGGGGGNGGGNGNGTQNPPPDNPPCDSDHHLLNLPRGLLHRCGGDTEGPPGDETCNDGIDNDGDGKIDQEDSDCQSPEGPPGDETCSDHIDNDGDGLTDGDDPDCQGGGGGGGPTCDDPDGDGVDHSNFNPEGNEGGLVSGIVHPIDQTLPSPLGGDGGLVSEVNCAVVVPVEEILGVNG